MASPGPDTSGPEYQPPKSEHNGRTESKLNGHESGDDCDLKPGMEPVVSSQPTSKTTSTRISGANVDKDTEKPIMNGVAVKDGTCPADKTDVHDIKAMTPSADTGSNDSTVKTSPDPDHLVPQVANVHFEAREPEARASDKKEAASEIAQISVDAKEEDTPMTEMHLEKEGLDSAGKAAGKSASIPSSEPAKVIVRDETMTDAPAEKAVETSKLSDAADAVLSAADLQNLPTSKDDIGPAGMSQLAIEPTEMESPPGAAPADILMEDAPVVKIARKRDEDAIEEPAPKRARTEPKDDDTQTAVAADTGASAEPSTDSVAVEQQARGLDKSALTKLTNWNDDATNARPLSQFQRREVRKILGRVKKTKSGGHFKDSVQKLWPSLWDQYVEKVESPMDLSELERSLRDQSCSIFTFGEFKANLALLFANSLAFNGPSHDVTAAASQIVKTVWEEVLLIPAEEPVKPRAQSKAKPMRESRAVANAEAAPRRPSAGPAANQTAEMPAAAKSPKAPEHPSADRRGSATTDGGDRPKRTVRAPKPKDIDYSTKPSRKKLKLELQFCDEVLTELMHPKNQHINTWFMAPVDAEGLGIPTYYAIIKKPMDLGKVRHMLGNGDIANLKDFDKNVRQIFENCYKFNGPPAETNPVAVSCRELEELYESHIKNKDAWLSKHTAKPRAAASTSNASDDDDGNEEGDDVEDPVADKEIEDMRAKLKEESEKLSDALIGGNQNLIDTQRGIVNIIQDKLIEMGHAKQARRKNDRGPKKPGKSGKSRATGSSGGRRSTGGTLQTKKPGGSKKTVGSRRKLTTSDKDQIATAINDLESPHLEKAIDLIKEDTGQNENTDGELELDIDQLSHDALLKLWELCKKALPSFGKDSTVAPNTSPEISRSAPGKQASKTATKPRKNKPMSAQEQEAKIAHLKSLRALYRPGQESAEAQKVTQAPTPMADSSDDSDSEEE